jgi:hypothetical protein
VAAEIIEQIMERNHTRRGRRWQSHEDALLRKHYPATGATACADELKRSPRAVYERASALGLKVKHVSTGRPSVWTDRHHQLLKHMVGSIAQETGHGRRAIVARLRRMDRTGEFRDAQSDD